MEGKEENHRVIFHLGDMVRIKEGPFTSFTARIEGINQAKSLLKVTVNIYGRATPIKLQFSAVEKIEFTSPDQPPQWDSPPSH